MLIFQFVPTKQLNEMYFMLYRYVQIFPTHSSSALACHCNSKLKIKSNVMRKNHTMCDVRKLVLVEWISRLQSIYQHKSRDFRLVHFLIEFNSCKEKRWILIGLMPVMDNNFWKGWVTVHKDWRTHTGKFL